MSTILSEISFKKLRGGQKQKLGKLARREALWGWAFLSPWVVGFLLWTLLPTLASFYFSFTDFNLLRPGETHWVGLQNYVRVFSDPLVLTSMKVSLTFAAIALPIGVIQPILMAALLNLKELRGKRFFTTLFYLPYIIPLVSAAYIWQGMMNTQTGWLNMFLGQLGISGPDWLNSAVWIYPSLVIIGLWGAGNMMLFTLTAMQNIPTELYEAARVDGAGQITTFLNITLPMITPIIFYNIVLSVIGIVQYFLVPFVLKGGSGDPGNKTMFYALQLYKQAFSYSDMGYGATMAWILFLFVLTATIVLFATAKYWVYYAAGEEK